MQYNILSAFTNFQNKNIVFFVVVVDRNKKEKLNKGFSDRIIFGSSLVWECGTNGVNAQIK